MNQATGTVTKELEPSETSEAYDSGARALGGASGIAIPVLREELEVRKDVITTGTVRLSKVVHEDSQLVSELLASENIDIERVPMDVIIEALPGVRTEGEVTIIPVVEEVLVVTKQLRLKEELRIVKRRSVSEYRQEVTLRSEELVVERVEDDPIVIKAGI